MLRLALKLIGYTIIRKTILQTPISISFFILQAYSTSSLWYAILDYGTNYCNLRNIVDGAGLSSENGFNEVTSTSICTQYDSINCERF